MCYEISKKHVFNLKDKNDLGQFLSSVNTLDGFYVTRLSVSSKCLILINSLLNDENDSDLSVKSYLELKQDPALQVKIKKLKFHCRLIRHLAIVKSCDTVDANADVISLENMRHLQILSLERVPIKSLLHLRQHRDTLVRLTLHHSIDSLESVITVCGDDSSGSGDNWTNLVHLDLRHNGLHTIDNSVTLLVSLTVLDISRNNISDLSFLRQIPTLECLNASFNMVRYLPLVANTRLRVLILGYNQLDSLEGIIGFKFLSTLNVSFNMIATFDCLNQLKRMDSLTKLILRGNPLFYSRNYKRTVLYVISSNVTINFSLDDKLLTRRENSYLRKGRIIFIEPRLRVQSSLLYKGVPVHVTDRHCNSFDNPNTWPQSNPNSCVHRPLPRSIMDKPFELSGKNNISHSRRPSRSDRPKEKYMESILPSGTDVESMSDISNGTSSFKRESIYPQKDSVVISPNYVGAKSSTVFVVLADITGRLFTNVSVQIIDDKFMVVDGSDVIVDNVNLWTLLVAVDVTVNQQITEPEHELKLVFFAGYDKENNDSLMLSTRNIIFEQEQELKRFLDQLDRYLKGFSIQYNNWTTLPLQNMSINCASCCSLYILDNERLRPYQCYKCRKTNFILRKPSGASFRSIIYSIGKSIRNNKDKWRTPRVMKPSLIRNFVMRAIFNPESALPNERSRLIDDRRGLLKGDTTSVVVNNGLVNLDGPIHSNVFNMNLSLAPHDCQEDNPVYAKLKSDLSTPWVINEPSCDINIHMHNYRKVDERLKIYLSSTFIHDREEKLISVFKVALVYRPTTMATRTLLVVTDHRIIIFSIVDNKPSTNIAECLKLVCEFPLTSLQKLKYCLHYQWIELNFRNKPIVTLLIGDADSAKDIGVSITEALSMEAANFSVVISKEMASLKSPHILNTMTNGLYDGVTMESLSGSETYLLESSSVWQITKKYSLEYDPKMIVIEAHHLFFITLTYSTKTQLPLFELSRALSLQTITNEIIIDSQNDSTLRLIIDEAGEKTSVDMKFMSPHSRSKAAFCIGKMWKGLSGMDIMFRMCDLHSCPDYNSGDV